MLAVSGPSRSLRILGASVLLALALLCAGALSASARAAGLPQINHLFIIVMENENAEATYGANPPAPYLANTMRAEDSAWDYRNVNPPGADCLGADCLGANCLDVDCCRLVARRRA